MPLEKINGFRAPFLAHDSALRDRLQLAGLTWDSSLSEQWGTQSASPDAAHKIWPFTFDYGSAIVRQGGLRAAGRQAEWRCRNAAATAYARC